MTQRLDLGDLTRYPLLAVDVETTGRHWYRDRLFGVAIAGCDVDGSGMAAGYWDVRQTPHVIRTLKSQLPRCKLVINHALKFDYHMLWNEDIKLDPASLQCTSVRAALINEHERAFDLDHLAKKYCGMQKVEVLDDLARLFGGKADRKTQMPNLHRAPEIAARYAIQDPQLALKLWIWQQQQIEKQGLQQVWDLERRLLPVIAHMERLGVCINVPYVKTSITAIDRRIAAYQKELRQLAGEEFNANSPKQLQRLFDVRQDDAGGWVTVHGVPLERTDSGAASIDADALRAIAATGDRKAILVHGIRKFTKARSFLTEHILGHLDGDRVHPNINQTRGDNDMGTGTGRFSINDPALQQIPARDEEVAEIVRSAFIAERGCEWVCADWEQFEFRWFAHYVNNADIIAKYIADPKTDYHQAVADMTGLPRNARFAGDGANTKQINLGLVFGMGKGKMAAQMGLPYTIEEREIDGEKREFLIAGPEAEAVFAKYHQMVPGVQALLKQASNVARDRGYVQTIHGRHLRFPGGKFTHKAAGLVFQGTSADCMKVKMLELYHNGFMESMRLTVHDELDFNIIKGRKKEIAEIKRRLETFDGAECPIKCRIPILSSVNVGPNWWEASK